LDPGELRGSEGAYLLPQLYATLYRWQENQLKPLVAESCRQTQPTLWDCSLHETFKWSNGEPLTAHDFARAVDRVKSGKTSGPLALTLLEPVESLKSLTATRLQIRTRYPVGDLLYRFTSIALAAVPESIGQVFSGPFELAEWASGQFILLRPNPFWPLRKPQAWVNYIFLADDATAIGLYEKNELDFVRRVPTSHIPQLRERPDFVQVPLARFDYLGFGPNLGHDPHLREAMALSLNYPETLPLLHGIDPFGCPSLPARFVLNAKCYEFNPSRAQIALSRSRFEKSRTITLEFSQQGGEDHPRVLQWAQSQWQKHIGLRVKLVSHENKYFLQRLREKKAEMFRKGIALNRPSCVAALETFSSSRVENYTGLKDAKFDAWTDELVRLEPGSNAERSVCDRAVRHLQEMYWIIPTGRFNFTLLVRPEFTGWSLNELNQLDLSDLRPR
jgi:oligopeptide transport system substrate-binding protein